MPALSMLNRQGDMNDIAFTPFYFCFTYFRTWVQKFSIC